MAKKIATKEPATKKAGSSKKGAKTAAKGSTSG